MKLFYTLLTLLAFAAVVFGQSSISSGSIQGTVFDPSAAAVPEAVVTVTNDSIAVNRIVVTSETGEYRALLLPPGVYQVKVTRGGFATEVMRDVQVTVGETTVLNFNLGVGTVSEVVDVTTRLPLLAAERTQQSTTIGEQFIHSLPIDRRDFLTYTLLAPGIVDSVSVSDANDFRVPQVRQSGLSFYGSNGRGNSVTVDGGEANDNNGGVRATLSQEAVQEFQINRNNYSAELGNASGGVINIVSKAGTNDFHGSAYLFFRDQHLDAADPFATHLVNGRPERLKPPSNRQQFGASVGGPLKQNNAFFFAAFEGLRRNESNSVSVLNDLSIFDPTPEQQAILAGLPQDTASQLRATLTSPESTREFFRVNSGVFPFHGTDYKGSLRVDHNLGATNRLTWRYTYANIDESNPNVQELRGVSRGYLSNTLDQTAALSWTRIMSARTSNELRAQFNYRSYFTHTEDPFGPEININGFGFFNRDYALPSNAWTRRWEATDGMSVSLGSHLVKFGGQSLIRGSYSRAQVFFGGRFTFGPLPGSTVSPLLASTSITSLQAFNLGLPQTYQQAYGEPAVSSTDPSIGVYVQDTWKALPSLTLNYGLRYELDDRRDPLPTDKNNFAPRFAFAWQPAGDRTTVRGGYGIFYSPTYYQIDWVVNALNELNGKRQIAQVLTTVQTPGLANAGNVFRTLRSQGVITFPKPTKLITPADLSQFGIAFSPTGPLPNLSVLFRNSPDFVNAYSQQASFGLERAVGSDLSLSATYIWARTLKIVRARDDNMLPAPVSPTLGIPVWSAAYFKRPELLQDNVYESTGRAFYNGLILEAKKRFSGNIAVNANYTLSKAIDEVLDFNSDFQASNQLNLRGERALSSFDQRHKFVVYGLFPGPFDLTLTPIVRANSSRPFNLLVGSDLNGDRHPSTDRPAFAGRNTGIGPGFWTFDLRVARTVQFKENVAAEFTIESFNLLNKLNLQSVNNVVGNIAAPFDLKGRRDLSPTQPLGFTSATDSRRVQIGLRLRF